MAASNDMPAMQYEQTLMYGSYTDSLKEYAQQQTSQYKEQHVRQRSDGTGRSCWRSIAQFATRYVGEDWIFLLVLGVTMALLSFFVDFAIELCLHVHVYLFNALENNTALQFLLWILYPVVLVMFSVGFTHIVSPHAVGSGIPEMKTVLRGVSLPNYLSMRTLVAKSIGLVTSLGSGIPIGKEGPFVHMASILGHNMSKLLTNINSMYLNESRSSELLAAACAVGVSSNFASPIGGVLFSIEVTSTYFAVRNYWRGFFAAVCSAFVFRLMAFWIKDEATITTLFTTHFRVDFPFDLQELLVFVGIGVSCGIGGALFVKTHRSIVEFRRRHRETKIGQMLEKNRFIFPVLWVIFVMTLDFPLALGRYSAGVHTDKTTLSMFFSNITWGKAVDNIEIYADQRKEAEQIIGAWGGLSIFLSLVLFLFVRFFTTAVSVSLPLPAGVFFPVFLMGACFGRLLGEVMHVIYPSGITHLEILPGGYAVVGAAAMAGAVTHTISTSVIVFELTGQITHILPVMIAVLVANGVVQYLQPSIYDSVIMIKKLPYLPDLNRSRSYNLSVADIMRTNLVYISYESTFAHLRRLLSTTQFRSYPLVDSRTSMILLGSVPRSKLEQLLHEHIWMMHLERHQAVTGLGLLQNGDDTDGNISSAYDEMDSGNDDSARLTPKQQRRLKLKRKKSRMPTRLKAIFAGGPAGCDDEDAEELRSALCEASRQEDDQMLQQTIQLRSLQIDPAPFQLVESTSLHKVHTLFSLLGLSHTYVTAIGRLVGVVTLDDVRYAVEGADSRRHHFGGIQSGSDTIEMNSLSRS